MSASLYTNIPLELRLLPNWVLWKYEDIGAAKPTKVPYSIKGYPASVTDAKHWATFDEAFNVLNIGNYSGLGFVFTKDDPYIFIDLDDAEGDDAILQRHLKVYHEFETYAEVSPSGKGLHLICKGNVPAGRRRSKIEIYPHERYATMTGNVYSGRNTIVDCQPQLLQLWEQMGSGPVAQSVYNGTDKEINTDEEIINLATNAINGDKFVKLYDGRWREVFPHIPLNQGPSEADFALVDIIAFYTQNVKQIERIFKSSYLGKRDKITKRADYVGNIITRSFDRMLPPLDFDGLKNAIDLKLAVSNNGSSTAFDAASGGSNPSAATNSNHDIKLNGSVAQLVEPAAHNSIGVGSSPATPTTPPGLLGDIATFIYQAAPRPVPEVALAAAISLMSGICGRAYNISGTGLNQYVLLLAMTGAGKEAAASGINKLMGKIRMQVPSSTSFIGPSEISSGAALFKYLGNQSQSFVSLLGEFGLRLQQMSSPNANGSEVSLRRMFLDLYNKSGHSEILHASVYSDKANNTSAVLSPSFSILGESTPERFYGALNEDMISEGLLPRFLLIEYKGNRPALNENHINIQPGFELVEQLASLAAQCDSINHSAKRKVINVDRDKEAALLLSDFEVYSTKLINKSNKEITRQLWNRAHMKVLKLSALIAVGVNPINPVINSDNVLWAANLVQADIAALTERFEAGEIGANSFEIKQHNDMTRIIIDYLEKDFTYVAKYQANQALHKARIVSHTYLSLRLRTMASFKNDKLGALTALKRSIQAFVDNGKLIPAGGPDFVKKYGTTQKAFYIHDDVLNDKVQ